MCAYMCTYQYINIPVWLCQGLCAYLCTCMVMGKEKLYYWPFDIEFTAMKFFCLQEMIWFLLCVCVCLSFFSLCFYKNMYSSHEGCIAEFVFWNIMQFLYLEIWGVFFVLLKFLNSLSSFFQQPFSHFIMYLDNKYNVKPCGT